MPRSQQWIFMDYLKRKIFLKYEIKKVLLKSLNKNNDLPLTYRYFTFYQRIKTPKWGILPQIVNRCCVTGRSNSITRKTQYSRFVYRSQAYNGNLPGVKRASW